MPLKLSQTRNPSNPVLHHESFCRRMHLNEFVNVVECLIVDIKTLVRQGLFEIPSTFANAIVYIKEIVQQVNKLNGCSTFREIRVNVIQLIEHLGCSKFEPPEQLSSWSSLSVGTC